MVHQVDDPEEDGVVLGVGVDQPFHLVVEVLLEHLLLDVHDPVEHNKDVCFGVGGVVEELSFLVDSA